MQEQQLSAKRMQDRVFSGNRFDVATDGPSNCDLFNSLTSAHVRLDVGHDAEGLNAAVIR
jgi:hypothetical protein